MSRLKERKEKNCLNCNAEIQGRFCHVCGQENIEPKETIWHLIAHFFRDITHFDGNFFGTIKYLIAKPGLDSGLMIPQYTAASIVSANKQLCTPASVDSIVSSNGQEDHVSMGANAATKCLKVVENVERILAIELMNAAQALEFRRPLKSSKTIENLHSSFRKKVNFIEHDKVMYKELDAALNFLREN